MKKKFKLDASDIKRLIPNLGYCFATDKITVHGEKVGFMYRERPDQEDDSGWRFFSGNESQEYADDPANTSIYDVNTIANYDPSIIPYLQSPYDTAFGRDPDTGDFDKEEFQPIEE